mmetsp:Transcript_141766/g.452875  ORF Transcript_141766/g.452875 Transcript_141766/m.452875 type:complete len:282 (+) Transcript_141766:1700-2545(+)
MQVSPAPQGLHERVCAPRCTCTEAPVPQRLDSGHHLRVYGHGRHQDCPGRCLQRLAGPRRPCSCRLEALGQAVLAWPHALEAVADPLLGLPLAPPLSVPALLVGRWGEDRHGRLSGGAVGAGREQGAAGAGHRGARRAARLLRARRAGGGTGAARGRRLGRHGGRRHPAAEDQRGGAAPRELAAEDNAVASRAGQSKRRRARRPLLVLLEPLGGPPPVVGRAGSLGGVGRGLPSPRRGYQAFAAEAHRVRPAASAEPLGRWLASSIRETCRVEGGARKPHR